jgi:hypothetical protein
MAVAAVDDDPAVGEGAGAEEEEEEDSFASVNLDAQLAEVMQRPSHLEAMLSLGAGLLQMACDMGWPATACMILQDLMLLKLMIQNSAASSGACMSATGKAGTVATARMGLPQGITREGIEIEEQGVRPATLEARKPAAVLSSAHVVGAVPAGSSTAAASGATAGHITPGSVTESSSRRLAGEARGVTGGFSAADRSTTVGSAPSSPMMAGLMAKRKAMADIWDTAAANGLSLLHRAVRSHSAAMVGGERCRIQDKKGRRTNTAEGISI